VDSSVFIVDRRGTIIDLIIVVGSIMQFDYITRGRVENGLEFVPLIKIARR
jgi:hypothetical protein